MRDRRRHAVIVLALLALAGWLSRPQPAVVVQITQAPPPEADESCMQPEGPFDAPAAAVQADTGGPPRPPPVPPTRCLIDPEVVAFGPTGTVRLDRRSGAAFEAARFADGALLVDTYDDVIGGTIYLDGFSPAELSFVGGQCRVAKVVRQASVAGVITPMIGAAEGQVAVQGCGANVQVDPHGSFFAQIDPGPCTLFAVRRDGGVTVRSVPVELNPAPGEDVVVDLALPTWLAASAGLDLRQDDDGATRIGPVVPGGTAAELGLVEGDEILAVDGTDVEGLSLWDVSDLEVGPDGTDVVYTVLRDGEPVELTLTRATEP
jgi:hypothetical protein